MKLTRKKHTSVVGLDIESSSAAATQLTVNGSVQVGATHVAPIQAGAVDDGEVLDPELLGASLSTLFSQGKLPKDVRIGVANQRLAMRVLRLPLIEDPKELETAIRFQAQDELPMPIDQAVLDFQVLRGSTDEDGSRQIDVSVVAARRDMVAGFMEAARHAGLRPIGIDLSAFGLIRALASNGPGAPAAGNGDGAPDAESAPLPTLLYCNLGDLVNLAVARGNICTFARVAPFGLGAIANSLAGRHGLTSDHARQWLSHVGLQSPVEELDGDPETVAATRDALELGASKLADELRLSLDFYSNQVGATPVEGVVFCGGGAAIPGLAQQLGQGIGVGFTTARPTALAHLDDATAARLTVSYGLALEQ